jgi:hypothetical protein
VGLRDTLLVVLVAVALAWAPLGAVLAASASQPMAGMEDCDHDDKGGCPCCDTPAQCPPDLCLAKCFKLVAEIVQPALVCAAAERLGDADCPLRPPNSREPPDPPPPRS